MNKLLLIDGNSIMNRAFYGIPDMTTNDGRHTNAIYGFLNIILKVIEEEQATHICVAFDLKKKTFRHEMYEAYKGTRKGMPEELHEQMPRIKEILQAMHIRIVEQEGFEADDLIGTIAKEAESCGMEPLIITGDKDGMTAQTNAFYLSRVIGNLLSNSAKFTESGTITLTCNIDKEKGQLVISVTDTGIGIPADKQEWVFERFTKVDDFKPGTGLGLYICRIIIQRLGGQIRIDTGYTSGCKMVVTLPV